MDKDPSEKVESWGQKLWRDLELGDIQLIAIYVFLFIASFVFVSSADTRSTISLSYGVHIILGVGALLTLLQLPMAWIVNRTMVFWSYVLVFCLGVGAFLSGSINGASRWIRIPLGFTTMTIQPSEFLKFLILWSGALMGLETLRQDREDPWVWTRGIITRKLPLLKDGVLNIKHIYWCGNFILLGLFITQNFSMFIIYVPFILLYPYLLGLSSSDIGEGMKIIYRTFCNKWVIGPIIALFLVVYFFCPNNLSKFSDKLTQRLPTLEHRMERAVTKVFGGVDSIDYKHMEQSDYALVAMSRDPFFPNGPGSSLLRKNLAQSESDYILSFIIEEYGIYFLLVLLMAYSWLIIRLLVLVRRYNDESIPLMRYLYHGFILLLMFELIIHLAVNTNILETGQSLPFLSKGGTSFLVHSLILGLLLRVGRYYQNKKEEQLRINKN